MVKLTLTGNMSTGGISIDRTFEAHPENVEIAEEAARVVGLDIAGIDFICPDITEPVRETGGAICEVNAAPGFRMHTHPTDRRAAVRRQARGRHALPARRPQPDPDRGGHRHQRQDHDQPDDRPHLQGDGPQGRHDLDRRRRHRRAAGDPRRRLRAAQRPGWCCRTRASTSPSSRWPAAASCARASATSATTSPSCSTCSPTTSACAASTPSSSSPTSRPWSSRPSPATGTPCSTPTTRWCGRCAAAARARSCGSRWRSPAPTSGR